PGRLTVNGGLAFGPGGRLALGLNGTAAGTGYDQLVVNGTVNLSGATLQASATSFASTVGTVYRLIDNDGTDAAAGTSAGIPAGADLVPGGKTFRLNSAGGTGNDVTLTHMNAASALRPRAVTATAVAGETAFVTGNPVDPDDGDDFR